MNPIRWYLLTAGGAAFAAATLLHWLHERRETPEKRERKRREMLAVIGRITDGTVIDLQERLDPQRGPQQFLVYGYDVAGVQYECSQEITYLRQLINLHSCRLGLPASIKYDPRNPGNSIVASESWSGLRK